MKMSRRKVKSNPDVLTRHIQTIVDKRLNEIVEIMSKTTLPRLVKDVDKIIAFFGMPTSPQRVGDFLGCLSAALKERSGRDVTQAYIKAVQSFVELYGEEVQTAQLEKLLNTQDKEK